MSSAPKLTGAKDDGGTGEDDQGKKEGRAVAYAVHLDVQGLRASDSMNEAISEVTGMQERCMCDGSGNVIAAYRMEAHRA
jgi:hypothetical protein